MRSLSRWSTQLDRRWLSSLIAACIILLLVADTYGLYKVYVQRVGNALDYYPFWAGGREVLLRRQSPYEPEVMLSIQEAIYGRPALPGENQHGYAYPAYAPFIVFPFLLLPFPVSASLWIALQQLLLVAAVILAVRATGWSIGPWHLLLLCLVAMTFRYTMITLVLGQTSTWVLVAISLALWAGAQRRSGLAGLALAIGLVKPQLVLLPALALLVSSQPRQRLRLLLSMGGAMAALLLGSWLLAGPWMSNYWHLLQAYTGYSTTEFPVLALAETWLSPLTSRIVNLLVIGGLLGLCAAIFWHARGSGRLALPVATAVTVTQLVVPQTGSYNLTLLVLPAIVALRYFNLVRFRRRRYALVGRVGVWTTLGLVPWLLWPLLGGQNGRPIDGVVLPLLILLALFAVLRLQGQDAHSPDGASQGAVAG